MDRRARIVGRRARAWTGGPGVWEGGPEHGQEGQECGKEGQERGQESQEPGQAGQEHGQEGQEHGQEGQERGQESQGPGQAGQEHGQEGQERGQESQEHGQEGQDCGKEGQECGKEGQERGQESQGPGLSQQGWAVGWLGPLDLSFNAVPSLQNYFSELNSLFYLDITRCQISWEYDGAFPSNRQLKTVILTRNLLMFLSATAFAGPYSLGHLTQTGITSIFSIPMTNLGNLRYLILGSNHTSSLQLPPNFPTRHLTLHFHINNTQAISAEGVQALQKNRHIPLILKGKDIPCTEPGSSQSHFYSLDLVSCADIPGALVGIQDYTAQTFWLGTFYGVEKEPYVSPDISQGLCSVSVKGLQPGSGYLEKLAKLQHLDLSQSHFESCSSEAVRALSRLCYQNLSHNIHLHLQECSDSASLELLDLPFTPLYVNTLQSPFQNLYLASARDDLSSSHINTSIQYVFQGLKNLMFLDLSQNNFDLGIMPKDKLFQLLSNLEVLILNASCELASVDNQVFHNLRKLQHVDLNYNKFTAFSTDAFSNPKSINLSCVHNRMHTVSNVQLVPLDGHLIINLSYDLLDCSWSKIDLITYKQYLNKIEDPERTRCSELKFLAGFSWPSSDSPVGRTHQESLQLFVL
ncbi:LOW QUALITY PROTEIN: CD180 antigen [Passerculus sandwichensis]